MSELMANKAEKGTWVREEGGKSQGAEQWGKTGTRKHTGMCHGTLGHWRRDFRSPPLLNSEVCNGIGTSFFPACCLQSSSLHVHIAGRVKPWCAAASKCGEKQRFRENYGQEAETWENQKKGGRYRSAVLQRKRVNEHQQCKKEETENYTAEKGKEGRLIEKRSQRPTLAQRQSVLWGSQRKHQLMENRLKRRH